MARLTLDIDGTAYRVVPIRSETPDVLKAFRLRKADGGAIHDVAHHGDHLACSCGDWTYRQKDSNPRGCKHCLAMVAVGLFDPIAEPAQLGRRPPIGTTCRECEGMGELHDGRRCRPCGGLGYLPDGGR